MTVMIPWPRREAGRHSRPALIQALRTENAKLKAFESAANDFFLRLLADRDDVYAAWQNAMRQCAEAETAAVCMEETARQLKLENVELLARLANVDAVTVPPAERDTSAPEDQATEPIPVRALWDALGAGPVQAVLPPSHEDPGTGRIL
ncbi:hypothetical protein [Streptomyces sp. CAU 1734]|uniref:hypothetical protein n=1 Tax=Streptomyces sp. CAU 1734 TaxID=3140360 RepID=UPI003261B797